MFEQNKENRSIKLFFPNEAWVEGAAIGQLHNAALLDGMKIIAGFPDLHPGHGIPVGAAFLNTDRVYPHLLGSDVGCGIGLWKTSLKATKIKKDKWMRSLSGLEEAWHGNKENWITDYNILPSSWDNALGTIGHGNHFAELQKVEKVYCQKTFNQYNLDKKQLFLLVHSGSRGRGENLLRSHTDINGGKGILATQEACTSYLQEHNYTVAWAKANRALIAKRFSEKLNSDGEMVLDNCHNFVSTIDIPGLTGWIHRKGAAVSDHGPLVLPGSRGNFSYLVEPTENQENNLFSLAHGAGRKWNRKSCRQLLKARFSPKMLKQTQLGSQVICDDRQLLYEEAPQAYKNIDTVVEMMKQDNLIKVIATFRPLITYKVRGKI